MDTEEQTETTVMHRASVVRQCPNPKNSEEPGNPNQLLQTEKRCSVSSTTNISSRIRKHQNASKDPKFLLITALDYKTDKDTIKERKNYKNPQRAAASTLQSISGGTSATTVLASVVIGAVSGMTAAASGWTSTTAATWQPSGSALTAGVSGSAPGAAFASGHDCEGGSEET